MSRAAQPISTPASRPLAAPPRGSARRLGWPHVVTALVWAWVGYVSLYWGLRLWHPAEGAERAPIPWTAPDIDTQAVARALGAGGRAAVPAAAPATDGAGRYALVGVLAGAANPAQGVALIRVEGQKPQPFAVGAVVDGRWVVQRITSRKVSLRPLDAPSDSGPGLTLAMPEPPTASR